jgi:hypothetical protein
MEVNMWPFSERRRNKRRVVDWEASLRCRLMSVNETVRVRVTEVSMSGARLELESMRVGPYHLVVGDTPVECELSISVPHGLVKSDIEFRWYNQVDADGVFLAGAEFVNMGPESKEVLKLALESP